MASNLSIVETLAHLEKKIVYHREQHEVHRGTFPGGVTNTPEAARR